MIDKSTGQILRILFFFIFVCSNVFAQNVSSEDELKKQADKAFSSEDFENALSPYSQLLSLYPKNTTYNYRYGVSVLIAGKPKSNSVDYLERAAKDPLNPEEVWVYLGQSYMVIGKFEDALHSFNKFESIASASKQKKFDSSTLKANCYNAIELLKSRKAITIVSSKEVIRNEFYNYYDWSLANGKIVPSADQFLTTMDKDKQLNPVMFIANNKQAIYISSYGKKGERGKDIFIIRRQPDGQWSEPENLGSTINSEENEDFPYLDKDGRTLYFSSKSKKSIGGYDIFKSQFNFNTGQWSTPENLGWPINTIGDDYLYVPVNNGAQAYYSTSLESSKKEYDLRKIEIPDGGEQLVTISGYYTPLDQRVRRDARVTVLKAGGEGIVTSVYTDPRTGKYEITLTPGQDYVLLIEGGGYLPHAEKFTLPAGINTTELKQIVKVNKDKSGEELILENYFYLASAKPNDQPTSVLTSSIGSNNDSTSLMKVQINNETVYVPKPGTGQKDLALVQDSDSVNPNVIKIEKKDGYDPSLATGPTPEEIQQKQEEQKRSVEVENENKKSSRYEVTIDNKELANIATLDAKNTREEADSLSREVQKLYAASKERDSLADQMTVKAETANESEKSSYLNEAYDLKTDADNMRRQAADMEVAVAAKDMEAKNSEADANALLATINDKSSKVNSKKTTISNPLSKTVKQDNSKVTVADNTIVKSEEIKKLSPDETPVSHDSDFISTTSIDKSSKEASTLPPKNVSTTKSDSVVKSISPSEMKGKNSSDSTTIATATSKTKNKDSAPPLQSKISDVAKDNDGQQENSKLLLKNESQQIQGPSQNSISERINQDSSNSNKVAIKESIKPSSNQSIQDSLNVYHDASITNPDVVGKTFSDSSLAIQNNNAANVSIKSDSLIEINSKNEIKNDLAKHPVDSSDGTSLKPNNSQNEIKNEIAQSGSNESKNENKNLVPTNSAGESTIEQNNPTNEIKNEITNSDSSGGKNEKKNVILADSSKGSLKEPNNPKNEITQSSSSVSKNEKEKNLTSTNLPKEVRTKNSESTSSTTIQTNKPESYSKSNADHTSSSKVDSSTVKMQDTSGNTFSSNDSDSTNEKLAISTGISEKSVSESSKPFVPPAEAISQIPDNINSLKIQPVNEEARIAYQEYKNKYSKSKQLSDQSVELQNRVVVTKSSPERDSLIYVSNQLSEQSNSMFSEAVAQLKSAEQIDPDVKRKMEINEQVIAYNSSLPTNSSRDNNRARLNDQTGISESQKTSENGSENLSKSGNENNETTKDDASSEIDYTLSSEEAAKVAEMTTFSVVTPNGTEEIKIDTVGINLKHPDFPRYVDVNKKITAKQVETIDVFAEAVNQNKLAVDQKQQQNKLMDQAEVEQDRPTKAQIFIKADAYRDSSKKNEKESEEKFAIAQKKTGEVKELNTAMIDLRKRIAIPGRTLPTNATKVEVKSGDLTNEQDDVLNPVSTSNVKSTTTDTSELTIAANNTKTNLSIDSKTSGIIPTTDFSESTVKDFGRNSFSIAKSSIYSEANPIPMNPSLPNGLIFKVQIGAFRKAIPVEKFEGVQPISAETTRPEWIRYCVGLFQTFEPAIVVKKEMQLRGFKDAFVVAYLNGKRIDLNEAYAMITGNKSKPDPLYVQTSQREMSLLRANNIRPENIASIRNNKVDDDEKTFYGENAASAKTKFAALEYAVQVGVFKSAIVPNGLKKLMPLFTEQIKTNLYRFTSDHYNDYSSADSIKRVARNGGVKDAFIVVYRNGVQASLASVPRAERKIIGSSSASTSLETTPEDGQKNLNVNLASIAPTVKDEKIIYRVQLGAFKNNIPFSSVVTFLTVADKGITQLTDDRGLHIFYAGNSASFSSASLLKEEIISKGITDAFVVALKDGKRIPITDEMKK